MKTMKVLMASNGRMIRYGNTNMNDKIIIDIINTVYFTLTQNNILKNTASNKKFIITLIGKIDEFITIDNGKLDKNDLEDMIMLKNCLIIVKKYKRF
jgi:hypothetical protein